MPDFDLMQVPLLDNKTQYQALKKTIDLKVQTVLDHGYFINGPEVKELEQKLAQFVGVEHAMAVASGTDALLIPMMALGIGPGDEVITSAFSFIATAETILLAGATPVYVDINPKTFNIDPLEVEKAITSKTKAIVPVSLYGQVADMKSLEAIAKKHNLFLIEDSAQSFGAIQNSRRSGAFGTASGTSFYPAKPLGCYGDGGAIFSSDANLVKVMKEIRDHGSESKYYHTRLGLNGRLDTIQCAILLAKLERYGWEMEQRQQIAMKYTQAFESLKSFQVTTPFVEPNNQSVWAQYTLTMPDREAFQKKMTELGVSTSVHYPRTMPDQPYYQGKGRVLGDLPFARKAAKEVVSLPLYADLSEASVDYVIQSVKSFFSK